MGGVPYRWTGPRPQDLSGGELIRPVPPERWPFGPPAYHEKCCSLRSQELYCDCKASDASDTEWGVSH